jgi:hypothetical protein
MADLSLRKGIGVTSGPGRDDGASCVFVQFNGPTVVVDDRGMEELTDRARLGQPLGPHGRVVDSIVLRGQWVEITAAGCEYLVPAANIRSVRRR